MTTKQPALALAMLAFALVGACAGSGPSTRNAPPAGPEPGLTGTGATTAPPPPPPIDTASPAPAPAPAPTPRAPAAGDADAAEADDHENTPSAPAPPLPAFQNPTNLPAAWTACSKDSCTMVRNECCDAWSVTVSHAEAAQREMNLRRSRALQSKNVRPGASPCRRSCAAPGVPTCEAGRCIFVR